MVVNVVYLLIKASIDHDGKTLGSFLEPTPIFYYLTAFLFFMISWEYNDYLILKQLKQGVLDLSWFGNSEIAIDNQYYIGVLQCKIT